MEWMGFLLVLVSVLNTGAADGWRFGRATFYADKGYYSIHKGSCEYGFLDYNRFTQWNIGAMPDVHYEYKGSCGRCYEVKCEPMTIKDRYGNVIDRTSACYDPEKVVTITITDTCPCGGGSRWCCGDADHIDLSYHAFDQLASRHWGVIGLKYRPVACPGSKPPPPPPPPSPPPPPPSTNGHDETEREAQSPAGPTFGHGHAWLRKMIRSETPVEAFKGSPNEG